MAAILQAAFSLIKFVPNGPVGSESALFQIKTPNKLQAITWANDDIIYWHTNT